MARMSSSNESHLLSVIKAAAVIFRALPFKVSMGFARFVGGVGYYLMPRKRAVVCMNLRTVFAGQKSPQEIRRIAKGVFVNFAQSFVELLCLPKIKRIGFDKVVALEGKENLDVAMAKGRGVVFLGIHCGNWELGSMVNSSCNYLYNVVANEQPKKPQLDAMLNEYRQVAGAKIITPGVGTRNIIRALKNNEIVCLVFDQGGKEGVRTEFLGRSASMSTGGVRIALRFDIPICLALIARKNNTQHVLRITPPINFAGIKYSEDGIAEAVKLAAGQFDGHIREHIDQYMWFYKVYKYSDEAHLLLLDDGKTGHLRQSQAVEQMLNASLGAKGKVVTSKAITVVFKNRRLLKLFQLYAFFAQFLPVLRKEEVLSFFVTPETYKALLSVKPDYIISCASLMGSLNFFLKSCYGARAICILKAGLVSWKRFDLVIAPMHDVPNTSAVGRIVRTKAALNLVSAGYLKAQGDLMLKRYSHLKGNVRNKIGVLLGGDTKGVVFKEAQVRLLLRQIKEAALHYNADILMTTSRRTSPEIDALVAKELRNVERCKVVVIANTNNIPEAVGGILALSDLILVSGESISMVSEAVSSMKPTIVFAPEGGYAREELRTKYDRFVYGLGEGGYVLASSIKDVTKSIHHVLRGKLNLKKLDDRSAVKEAIEEML